jgi:hypothetical protein
MEHATSAPLLELYAYLTESTSLATLIDLLAFLASTAGAGWAATRIFDWLRTEIPRPTVFDWPHLSRFGRVVMTLLYAPRYARMSVFVLASLISIISTVLLAQVRGESARPAFDAAVAVIVTQLLHLVQLPAEVTSRRLVAPPTTKEHPPDVPNR